MLCFRVGLFCQLFASLLSCSVWSCLGACFVCRVLCGCSAGRMLTAGLPVRWFLHMLLISELQKKYAYELLKEARRRRIVSILFPQSRFFTQFSFGGFQRSEDANHTCMFFIFLCWKNLLQNQPWTEQDVLPGSRCGLLLFVFAGWFFGGSHFWGHVNSLFDSQAAESKQQILN